MFKWLKRWLFSAVIQQTQYSMEVILDAIETFVAAQNAYMDEINAALTAIVGDIENLNAQILALSSAVLNLPAADQALLDNALQASAALAKRVADLDALTPPVAPVPPAA